MEPVPLFGGYTHESHYQLKKLAFRGQFGSLLGYLACGVSLEPIFPQDKEGFGSHTSHEENVKSIFEESRFFHSYQQYSLIELFQKAEREQVPIKMTFDFGNWSYSCEDVWEAAQALEKYVLYLHLKHVEKHNSQFVTMPLPVQEPSDWRKLLAFFPKDIIRAIEFPLQIKTSES